MSSIDSRLSRRILRMRILVTGIAVVAAFLLGSALVALAGINPLMALRHLFLGALGTKHGIGETLTRFIPLFLATLSFAIAMKVHFYNVGIEGQIALGSFGALLVGIYVTGLPAPIHIFLCLLAAVLFGVLWLSVAGFLKFRFGANELLTTVMLNYIVVYLMNILIETVFKDPDSMIDQSQKIAATAKLPRIMEGTTVHVGLFIAMLVGFIVYYYVWRTPSGFELRAVGANSKAAKYAGISPKKLIIIGIIISGGLAGLGGGLNMLGYQSRWVSGTVLGYGFDGIGAAVMGQYHPLGMAFSALLFAIIRVGGGAMQRSVGVPYPLVHALQGIVIMAVIISAYFIEKRTEKMTKGGQ